MTEQHRARATPLAERRRDLSSRLPRPALLRDRGQELKLRRGRGEDLSVAPSTVELGPQPCLRDLSEQPLMARSVAASQGTLVEHVVVNLS